MANGKQNGKHRRNGATHAKRNSKPMAIDPSLTGQLAVNDVASDESGRNSTTPTSPNQSPNPSESSPVETVPSAVAPSAAALAQGSPEGESLNKIRDILFGQQVQTHDLRFENLERQVSEDYEHLKADFIERLDALENRLVDHLDRLGKRLREEESARENAVERTEEKLSAVNQDIRAEIKHQSLTLKDALEQQIYDVLTDLEKEKKTRQQSTRAERAQLSKLFSELSSQLADELADDA